MVGFWQRNRTYWKAYTIKMSIHSFDEFSQKIRAIISIIGIRDLL